MQDDSPYMDEKMCRGQHLFKITTHKQMEQNIMHQCIGALTFNVPSSNILIPGYGTGFLISPNLVLTAAHNLYNSETDTINVGFKFYPGACGKLDDPYEVEEYRFLKQEMKDSRLAPKKAYRDSKAVSYDFALVKLAVPVKRKAYLKLGLFFEHKIDYLNTNIAIFGYPYSFYDSKDKKGDHFEAWQGGLERQGRLLPSGSESSRQTSLQYQISTQGGQSGAPVIIGQSKYEIVVGIHKAGKKSTNCNVARIITLDLLGTIQKWRKSLNGIPFMAVNLKNGSQVPSEMFQLGQKLFQFDKDTLQMTFTYLSSKIQRIDTSCEKCGINDTQKAKMIQLITWCQHSISSIDTVQLADELFNKSQLIQSKIKSSQLQFSTIESQVKQYSGSKIEATLAGQPYHPKPVVLGQKIEWDKSGPSNHQFYFEGRKVTRMSAGAWYQAISATPVRHMGTYSMRAVKFGGKSSIYMGVVLGQKKMEKWNSFKKDAACYWSWIKYNNWQLFLHGEKQESGAEGALKEGGILRMQVDLQRLVIIFTNEEIGKEMRLNLPNRFQGKDLFLFTSLFEKGSSIELIY